MNKADVNSIRCFIAVKLPQDVLQELADVQRELMSRSRVSVKWVAVENMHLTLKFLGDITPTQVEPVVQGIQQAVSALHSFSVAIEGAGVFPNPQRVQVIWIGLSGEVSALASLQKNIDTKLQSLGFPCENRAFTPHLTIGRVREHVPLTERKSLGETVNNLTLITGKRFIIDRVYLVKSVLSSRGPAYTDIASVPLI